MCDETWRPLGVESDEEIKEFDTLVDGIPSWLFTPFWIWVEDQLIYRYQNQYYTKCGRIDFELLEAMCQTLRIPLPDIRLEYSEYDYVRSKFLKILEALKRHSKPLEIADYLLAFGSHVNGEKLEQILHRSKSIWTVGVRSGRNGLVRRVPKGVRVGLERVAGESEKAGIRLAEAWDNVYSLDSDPSKAYVLAVRAVEDAAIPVVSPNNSQATLGSVIAQIQNQKDWTLPISRENDRAPSGSVVVSMLRLLWHGQHDRHGGQQVENRAVSREEAIVAIGLATTLIHWFSAGLVSRKSNGK